MIRSRGIGLGGFLLASPANTWLLLAILPFHEPPPHGEDVVEC
jgi:hypothetical protein